jgi:hypothetical protein
LIAGAFEVGHITLRDMCCVDDFCDQSGELGVEGEEEGLDDALRKTVDERKENKSGRDTIYRILLMRLVLQKRVKTVTH